VVKVAYVETEVGATPRQIGQIQGTPTIKAFVPKRSSSKNEKTVVDYDQGREVGDLMRFATAQMPNFVEPLGDASALKSFDTKAQEWQLPRVLVFSNKAGQTSTTLKALSAEYRRRVLIGELKAQKHADAVKRFRIESFPTLLCLPAAGGDEPTHRFEKKETSYRRLDSFIGRCALRKPVLSKPTKEEL